MPSEAPVEEFMRLFLRAVPPGTQREVVAEMRACAEAWPEHEDGLGLRAALVDLLSGGAASPVAPPLFGEALGGLRGEVAGVALFVLVGFCSPGVEGIPAKMAQIFRGMAMKFIKKFKVTTKQAAGATSATSAYFAARAGLGYIDVIPHPPLAPEELTELRRRDDGGVARPLDGSLPARLLDMLHPSLREGLRRQLAVRPWLGALLPRLDDLTREAAEVLAPWLSSACAEIAGAGRGSVGFSPEKDAGLLLAWAVEALERGTLPSALLRRLLRRRLAPRRRAAPRRPLDPGRLAAVLRAFDRSQRRQIARALDALERPLEGVNLEGLGGSPCPRSGCAGLLCRATESFSASDEKSDTRLTCTRCSFQKTVA